MYEPEFDAEGDERGYYVPIVGDTDATGNKFDKIEKLVPYFKRGDIIFDIDQKNNSDYEAFVGQFIDFERGSSANDDAPDCFVEGLLKLNKRTGGRRSKGKDYKTNPRRKPKGSW
jgi:hypothetical protein